MSMKNHTSLKILTLMNKIFKYDLVSLLAYTFLVFFGIVNVYSSSYTESFTSIFDYSTLVGKQLIFLGISALSLIFLNPAKDILLPGAYFLGLFSHIFKSCTVQLPPIDNKAEEYE